MIDKLLNKLANQEKDFLNNLIFAPYIKGGSKIVVRLNGIIYKLNTPKFRKDGFGIFRATDANNAKRIREAEPFEKEEYLHLLPKVDVILVAKIGRWMAYPSNTNSFKQRFGQDPSLLSILVADNIEVMDTVEARFDGLHFWFDCMKFGGDTERKENLRDRLEQQEYTITKAITTGLTPEESEAFKYAVEFHREANKSKLEKRLEAELAKTGAAMDKFIERGGNVEVQWRDKTTNGKYTSILNKEDLSIVTAGICLSGGDKRFDLQSLVTVCRQNERRGGPVHVGRGGMSERAYWDMYGRNR
ncbi:MAG: hypothetical protein ACTSU6_01360 [Candidatus Njordarchaeales archaeon]